MDFLWKGEVSTAEISVNDELRKRITDAQQKDEDMQKVFKAMKEGGDLRKSLGESRPHRWYLRRCRSLLIRDGILYNTFKDGDERIGQMVIPKSMVHEILQRAHGDYRSGHPGTKRMFGRLERFCVWPMIRHGHSVCHDLS